MADTKKTDTKAADKAAKTDDKAADKFAAKEDKDAADLVKASEKAAAAEDKADAKEAKAKEDTGKAKWFHDADHSASAERLAAQHARDVASGVNVPLEGTDDKSRPGMREDQKPNQPVIEETDEGEKPA